MMVITLGWLIRTAPTPTKNLRLEGKICYSTIMVLTLLFLAAFMYGRVQGLRKRLAIFIDDEFSLGLADAWGIPLTSLVLPILAYLFTLQAAPTGLESPKYANIAIALLPITWTLACHGCMPDCTLTTTVLFLR